MKLRILQISDLHVGSAGEQLFDADPRQYVLEILAEINDLAPDVCCITGDLSMKEPNLSACHWIKEQLELLQFPYYVIAGNHDDSQQIAELFHPSELKKRELYYSKRINGHFIVFLDTSRGRCSPMQWKWLRKETKGLTETLHVVMHHPPIYGGVAHMDNHHAFIEQEEFLDFSRTYGYPIHVYCGHYHVSRHIHVENLHIHIAPSTLFQIDPFHSEFKLGSKNTGFNVIDIDSNRVVVTTKWINHE